jgi:drug/metabolite transporter (DMT)-like permease
MRRLQADALLLFAAAVWGLAFVFQKTAMEHVGPLLFIAARGVIAALALAPLAVIEMRRTGGARVRDVLGVALAGGGAFFLGAAFQQFGIKTATVTNTGFLTALYVVIVPFLAWIAYRRAPGALIWPAAALSFAGTWLLGGGTIGGFSGGDGLVAICAVFWALHVVVTGRAARHGRPVLFTCLQFATVAALGLAGALAAETITVAGLVAAGPEILYVGLLSSALTFTILSMAMRYTSPSEAAVIVSTETLFAALAGAVMLGERLTPVAWAGAGLILFAVLLVQIGPSLGRRRAKTARPGER